MFFEIGVLKVCNIHRKASVLDSLFSKVASLETYKFIKKRLQHRYFLNIANFLWKVYLKNTTDGCLIISIGKLMTYIFNEILCVSMMYFFILFAISFAEVIKACQINYFWELSWMQNRTSVFDKKVVTWFDKKIATWRRRTIDEEKNLLLYTLKKKTLSLRT